MHYKLNIDTLDDPLYPWTHIFWSLSIKQFRQVYNNLEFPFNPSESVQQIAHDFAFTWDLMNRNPEYTTIRKAVLGDPQASLLSIDLLKGTNRDDTYLKRCNALFTNTFIHLENMGFAESIYSWGRQTHGFHKFSDIQALSALWYPLIGGVIVRSLAKPLSYESLSHSTEWGNFVSRYASNYTNSYLTFEDLPLSDISHNLLQTIILKRQEKKTQLENVINILKLTPTNIWEDFALRRGTARIWITLEGSFRVNLHTWNTIINTLSTNEVNILEKWVLSYKDKDPNLIFLRNLNPIPRDFMTS